MRRLVRRVLIALRMTPKRKLLYVIRIPFGIYGDRVTWSDFLEVRVNSDYSYAVRHSDIKEQPDHPLYQNYCKTIELIHLLARRHRLDSIEHHLRNAIIIKHIQPVST